MKDTIERYEIRIDDSVLADLRTRLGTTRLPDQIPGSDWEYGIPVAYLRELVDHWRDAYDWRIHEARLNELDQFLTIVDGQSIHFVHGRSEQSDALPLLLVHGWPGSFLEFLDVIPRLRLRTPMATIPWTCSTSSCPRCRATGSRSRPGRAGWDVDRIAVVLAALMHRLGYERYGAQGGDWGAQVVTRIGALDPEHCVAIHVNMPIATPPADKVLLTDADKADLAVMRTFQREESGYAIEQGTKPQTLGVALNDSPAGLLAWIVEKFRAWSDCNGEPESVFTRDQLLTNVTLYWVTQTITSSARLYWEHQHAEAGDSAAQYVRVPTGVARYPKEVVRFPRSWVERSYNVTYWAEMPRGGHFAAMEQPELFTDDVRSFFRTIRER